MIESVWKYELTPKELNKIEMPEGARILRVATQHHGRELDPSLLTETKPCLWVLVNPIAETETRYFLVLRTGQEFESTNTNYIGSFSFFGPYEFHVFEELRQD